MQHRKATAWVLLLALVLVSPIALAQERDAENDAFFLKESQALTMQMQEMTSAPYVLMFSASGEINELAAKIGSYAYDKPSNALMLAVDGEAMIDTMLLMGEDDDQVALDGLSDTLKEQLYRRMAAAIPARLVGMSGGTVMLATTSVLTASRTYQMPSAPFTSTIVCLQYEDLPYMSVTSFVQTGEDTITATAMFAPAEQGEILDELLALITAMEETPIEGSGLSTNGYTQEDIEALLGA